MERIEIHACFGGSQEVWQHSSDALDCNMRFGIYLPSAALQARACPVLYWLSGLTCSEQNFINKAGAQQHADQHGIIVVTPDTSPRGDDVPNDDAYDLGQGASFYLDATAQPWAEHYRMHEYVVHELPSLVEKHFPANNVRSVSGHSMGGHGALTIALRNPGYYRSASAFSPIVAPSQVPWGIKAFSTYLGDDPTTWQQYDAVKLIESGHQPPPLLVDQGDVDPFLKEQLKPQLLQTACDKAGVALALNMRPGFDHNYYFIASFIADHIAFHAKHMQRAANSPSN